MTKKNKSKRNKKQEDFPSLYMMQDDYPVNKYGLGSAIKGAFKDAFSADGLKGIANAGIGSLGSVVGNIGGGLISGGKSSGVGNAIGNIGGTIGGAIGAVNPVAGAIVGAASGVLGGITNAAFGSKLNEERIAQAENEINKAKSFNANATNFDDLSQQMASQPVIAGFSQSDIGSDGLFSNKAKNKYRELLAQKQQAESWVDRSIANNAVNLQQNQMNNLLQNYAAFGGPLGYGFDGALGYDLANQQLGINAIKAMGQNRQYSLPNMGLNTFAEGGGIHIKPSKRGTFTAAAKKHGKGVQEFASQVLANKENYSPAMVKKAQFARNATKFKHEDGGFLDEKTLDLINDHPLALWGKVFDPTGISSYYDVYKAGKEFYNNPTLLNAGALGLETFGAIPLVGKLGKALKIFSKGRKPLDAVDSAGKIAEQMMIRTPGAIKDSHDMRQNPAYKDWDVKNKKAFGGDLLTNGTIFSNGITTIGNGGTHEESPYEGVQLGVDPQGIPNLVEENEVIWNDYVFSDRIKVPKTVKEKQKLKGNKNMTFADAANKIQKISEERPNDPISMETMDINLTRLAQEQEALRQQKNLGQEGRKYAKGGTKVSKKQIGLNAWDAYNQMLTNPYNEATTGFGEGFNISPTIAAKRERNRISNTNTTYNTNNNYATWLRYAPVAGSILGLSQTLLSKPNYSRADALAQYAQNAGKIQPISYEPIDTLMTYKPVDQNYIANRMAAQAAATRRNIMNTAGGNRANAVGSLLAADYNAQIAQADAIRQGEDVNWNRLMQTQTFNRGTKQANAEMALKAAMANQEARLKTSQMGLSGYTTAMQMKDAIDAQRNASINANMTALFDNLGDIGREEMTRRMVMENPALLYDYYGRYKNNESAKGGKLNKKKRGGFTY